MKIPSATFCSVIIACVAISIFVELSYSWIRTEREIAVVSSSVGYHSQLSQFLAVNLPADHSSPLSNGIKRAADALIPECSRSAQLTASAKMQIQAAPAENQSVQHFSSAEGAIVLSSSREISGSISSIPLQLSESSAPADSPLSQKRMPLLSIDTSRVVTASSQNEPATTAASANIPIPAAFGDPAKAGITSPEQNQAITQMADNFTKEVQSSGAAPDSPAYFQIWNNATSRANQLFKQQYGNMAFEAMQQSTTGQ
jgi:hypothetical protein